MESNAMPEGHEQDGEEFVLLDLDVLFGNFQIPPNAPYVLSGLDTLNPVLVIDGKIKLMYGILVSRMELREISLLKLLAQARLPNACCMAPLASCTLNADLSLIGEYEETIGTCFAFSEVAAPVGHRETGSSELNLFSGKCIVDSNQSPRKQVKPVARLHKVLKFKILLDEEVQDTTGASI